MTNSMFYDMVQFQLPFTYFKILTLQDRSLSPLMDGGLTTSPARHLATF